MTSTKVNVEFKKLVCYQLRPGKEYLIIQITLIANSILVAQTMEQGAIEKYGFIKGTIIGSDRTTRCNPFAATIIWNWAGLSMIKMVD